MTGAGEEVMFWIVAPIIVVAALGLLFARKAVHAALSMALAMILIGVFYLANEAPFLGIVHIVVYTGAVMMLFLFVVMLVGVESSTSLVETLKGQRWLALLFSLGLFGLFLSALGSASFGGGVGLEEVNASPGNVNGLANLIFGRYVWVFEVTSTLLITAALAAMVLAHRTRLAGPPDQREWSIRRFREGRLQAGLPPPGVYARHNAVDTPALLPDGSVSELSVSRVLTAREQVSAPSRYSDDDVARSIEAGKEDK